MGPRALAERKGLLSRLEDGLVEENRGSESGSYQHVHEYNRHCQDKDDKQRVDERGKWKLPRHEVIGVIQLPQSHHEDCQQQMR